MTSTRVPSARRTKGALLGLLLVTSFLMASAPTADATIDTSATALQIAQAMFTDPSLVAGAAFVAKPPSGTPDAVADSGTALTGFPTHGTEYGVLTTGDATLAPTSNCCTGSGASDGGGNIRGDSDYDVTILRIDFEVPFGNCLTVGDFRFLSEEFPEYVGSSFNDAFIAELDVSTWTTSGSTITAPDNFAFDTLGNPITINAAGSASMSSGDAAGTTYDGATPILKASTPISAGAHTLYFSIFDQGDQIYDSAVFLDNIDVQDVPVEECQEGAQPVNPEPAQAHCEGWGVYAIERDLTTGQVVGDLDASFSHSKADVREVPGPWPASIPPPGAPPEPPVPAQAHAEAQQMGYRYVHGASQIEVSASSIHSRCDVLAVGDSTQGAYTQAYARGGIEDLTITRAGNVVLYAEAVDFELMGVGTPTATYPSAECEIVAGEVPPSSPFTSCTPPWTRPVDLDAGPVHVTVTLNEQWGALPHHGPDGWDYGGDVVHICIQVDGVSRTDIYFGLVGVGVTGTNPANLPPPLPDGCEPDQDLCPVKTCEVDPCVIIGGLCPIDPCAISQVLCIDEPCFYVLGKSFCIDPATGCVPGTNLCIDTSTGELVAADEEKPAPAADPRAPIVVLEPAASQPVA